MKSAIRTQRPARPFVPRKGAEVIWEQRLARIEAIVSASEVLIHVSGTRQRAWVRVEDLGAPVEPDAQTFIRAPADPVCDERAVEWHTQLRRVVDHELTVKQLAVQMNVSRRSIQRRLARHLAAPLPGAQLDGIPGPAPGSRLLRPAQEAIIEHAIEREFMLREHPPMTAVSRRVTQDCKTAGVPVPSYKAVRSRILSCDRLRAAKRRLGPHEGAARQAPSVRGLATSRALEVVQIDHALVDLILVTPGDRQPIGRPWITLAIDVFTRCVVGYHLGFEVPNQTAVGLCLEHACLPKGPWLRRLGVDVDYPMCGRMESVAWDNAKTFQAKGVQAQCERYGITVRTRPVRQPHYGAYIERYIGTFMGKVHVLPGTTFSNSKARADYASERHAVMTLPEFAHWVAQEIAGVYHNTPHRGLAGLTPKQAWTKAWLAGDGECLLPPLISDAREFVLGFLPTVQRRVGREGLHVLGLRYWDPALVPLINDKQSYRVHYHQGDLSKVYLHLNGHYVDVPLLDRTQPPFSIDELREARRVLREEGVRTRDDKALFAALQRQRQLEDAAVSTSKKARRKQSMRAPTPRPSAGPVDFSTPVKPLDAAWEDTL